VETKCNLRGVQKQMRLYLVKNLPRKCLIEWPQFKQFRAVIDVYEGTYALKALGVTLRLLKFGQERTSDNAVTVCAFTPTVPASAPSLDILNSASSAPILPIMEPAPIAPFTERSLAANLNPNDAFTFDDMFSRSYAGNVILLALPTELIPILLLMRLILENLFLILKQLNQTLILTIIL